MRMVEVVAICILQSWDGTAMAESGGRSVVAIRGYFVALFFCLLNLQYRVRKAALVYGTKLRLSSSPAHWATACERQVVPEL